MTKAYNPANVSVLIIDDNILNVEMLKKCLIHGGYSKVVATTNPLESVDLFKKHAPHVILLDLNMPGHNGFEVLQELQQINEEKYLPVLVLTAEEDQSIRIKALQCGAKDLVVKPYNAAEILARVKNIAETADMMEHPSS